MAVIVFVSKFAQISSMFLQFTALAFPQLDIEVAGDIDSITTKNPVMVVNLIEEDCNLALSRYPGKLRFISRNSILLDFTELMRREGVEPKGRLFE